MNPHFAAKWESRSTKNIDDHGDNRIMNPVQKNSPNAFAWSIPMMHHPLSLSWQGAPTLRLPRNYFFEKKPPFSPEFVECMNLQLPMHREEKKGHFWPCQLRSLAPSTSTWGSSQGVFSVGQKQGEFNVFALFSCRKPQNSHLFLFQLTWCSYKHITINNKKWRQLGLKKTKRSQTFPDQIRWVHRIFYIVFPKNTMKCSPFCAIFPNAGTNLQQSTIKEDEVKSSWENTHQ